MDSLPKPVGVRGARKSPASATSSQVSYLKYLPYESEFDFLKYLSYRDIINYCATHSRTRAICQDQGFWKMKYEWEHGKTLVSDPVHANWRKMYEMRMNEPNRTFFVIAGLIYAFINDQGQLFISYNFDKNPSDAPRLLPFNKKIIDLTSDDFGNIGAVTEDGEAFNIQIDIDAPNPEDTVTISKYPVPNDMDVIKMEYFHILDEAASVIIMLEDRSLWQTDSTGKLKDLPNPSVNLQWDYGVITWYKLELPTYIIPINFFSFSHTKIQLVILSEDLVYLLLDTTDDNKIFAVNKISPKEMKSIRNLADDLFILLDNGKLYVYYFKENMIADLFHLSEKIRSIDGTSDMYHLVTENGQLYFSHNMKDSRKMYIKDIEILRNEPIKVEMKNKTDRSDKIVYSTAATYHHLNKFRLHRHISITENGNILIQ